MRHFSCAYIISAMKYALDGGQALHTFRTYEQDRTREQRHGTRAHLIDHDTQRLRQTARALGIPDPVVNLEGTRLQHVELYGDALDRALKSCH